MMDVDALRRARHVRAGRDLNFEEGCQFMGLRKQAIVFGDRCTVGRGAMISQTGISGGEPGGGLQIGDHSNIGHYAVIGCSGFIDIRARVLTGPRVCLTAEDQDSDDRDLPIKAQGVTQQSIVIEDDVWLVAGVPPRLARSRADGRAASPESGRNGEDAR